MIGIKAIASYLPDNVVSNLERAEAVGKDVEFITDKIGFTSLVRKLESEDTSDMCVKAFEKLLQQNPEINAEEIECIVLITQNPDSTGVPFTSSIIQHKLGLPETIAAFDVSLACSGFVYGLSIIQAMMNANGMTKGVMFTCDPFSKVIDPEDLNTELLFGDAAAATYITEDPVFVSGKTLFGTGGKLSHSIRVDEEPHRLQMMSSNVFKFALSKVPPHVNETLALNDVNKDEVDLFLLHQASKYIIDNLAPAMEVDRAKVPFEAAEVGNTISATIPLMLERYMASEHNTILISGFGAGLSWATSVLKRA